MSLPILSVSFGELKENVKKLDKQVHDMAANELHLTSIDPVLYLYAIVKLGPANASAKWMIKLGLSERVVLNYIQQNLPKRPLRRRNLLEWMLRRERKHVRATHMTWTPALVAMTSYLRSLDGYTSGSHLYVRDVFTAVIDSTSPHIEQLFASIDVSMEYVRVELGLDQPLLADAG